jgi:ribosomal protein S16
MSTEHTPASLEEVQAGDALAEQRGAAWDSTRIVIVDRVTATQIVCGRSRYRKKDGRLVGRAGYWAPKVEILTPKIRAEIKLTAVEREIRAVVSRMDRNRLAYSDPAWLEAQGADLSDLSRKLAAAQQALRLHERKEQA